MAPIQTLVNFPVQKLRQRKKTAHCEVQGNKEQHKVETPKRLRCRYNKENSSVARSPKKSSFTNPICDNNIQPLLPVLETPKRKSPVFENANVESPTKKTKHGTFADTEVKSKTFKPLQLFKQDVSAYQQAKLALHTSAPSRLVGRETECSAFNAFLTNQLKEKKSGSLYISGAPGTGKTACLAYLLDRVACQTSFISVFINCMTVRHSSTIFEKIGKEIGCEKHRNKRELLDSIEENVTRSGPMIVLVLDEMDHLTCKSQDVLYTVFEWPRLPNSRLILIGISNALDLTDRVLPRLHACGCHPELLHFAPYTREQIINILSDRLRESSNLIKPSAIQMCARKIAACTGDIRKALDTCRRALELVEREIKTQSVLKATSDDRCNEGSPKKSIPTAKQVDVPQIVSVLHEIYGSRVISSQPKTSAIDSTLPIQQKLLLCTLLLMTRGKSRDVLVGKLQETYTRVCRKQKIGEVNSSELMCICSLLESRSLLQVKNNKEARLSKVSLKIDEEEMLFVLKDKVLLSTVLNDNSVLK